jgi:hypothetical protein
LRGQMCQPRWWGESEQMHARLRPAGDQMYDTGKSIPAPLLNSGRVSHWFVTAHTRTPARRIFSRQNFGGYRPVSGHTEPQRRRRSPSIRCQKLLRRPGQLTSGGRRSNRSGGSGFRPDMCEGAWQPPRKSVGRHSIRYGQNSSNERALDGPVIAPRGRPPWKRQVTLRK